MSIIQVITHVCKLYLVARPWQHHAQTRAHHTSAAVHGIPSCPATPHGDADDWPSGTSWCCGWSFWEFRPRRAHMGMLAGRLLPASAVSRAAAIFQHSALRVQYFASLCCNWLAVFALADSPFKGRLVAMDCYATRAPAPRLQVTACEGQIEPYCPCPLTNKHSLTRQLFALVWLVSTH